MVLILPDNAGAFDGESSAVILIKSSCPIQTKLFFLTFFNFSVVSTKIRKGHDFLFFIFCFFASKK